jgi:hypothetical protein
MIDVKIKYIHLQFLPSVFDGKMGLQSERLKKQFVPNGCRSTSHYKCKFSLSLASNYCPMIMS